MKKWTNAHRKQAFIKDNVGFIELSRGMFAKVDPEDVKLLSEHSWWFCRGYASAVTDHNKRQRMHRFLLNPPIGMEVDHINGDRSDNRRSNLRICRKIDNLRNRRKIGGTSSAFKGLSWDKKKQKWECRIMHERLGYFESEFEAALRYNIAAIFRYGEFANLNIF